MSDRWAALRDDGAVNGGGGDKERGFGNFSRRNRGFNRDAGYRTADVYEGRRDRYGPSGSGGRNSYQRGGRGAYQSGGRDVQGAGRNFQSRGQFGLDRKGSGNIDVRDGAAQDGNAPMVLKRQDDASAGVGGGDNPLTGRPYSQHYEELMEVRKKLPIYSKRDEVLKTVLGNKFVVLVGDTGSGKTTQVPQLLALHRGKADGKIIACTQPRRIAAITVAQRVAEEMDVRLGDEVGYAIRYEDVTSSRTVLKYCTDGLLLRESVSDPMFTKYGIIIIDEVHERTISTDILMGILKQVTQQRDDFRLVIMSATLDVEKLTGYFNNAPLLSIPGRMFPVDIRFLSDVVEDYLETAVASVIKIHENEGEGDILVFLTGEDEINNACKDLTAAIESKPTRDYPRGVHILPLYSSLPPNSIQKVFVPSPEGKRKIVISTNVAETSITIDGIVYVVDPGFAKQKVYNPRNRVESLQVAPVSAASAVQRTGRAGRTRPGVCFRLYTEESFEQLTAMTYPEVLRSNLNSVVLQLRTLGVNPVQFDFIDPPPPETVMRALESLLYLGALDAQCSVTELGQSMSVFPLDPELSKMVLAAPELGVAQEVLAIVAMLSAAPNCFVRPTNKQREADAAKRRFEAEESDHLTLLNVFTEYLHHRNYAKDWCWENFLNDRSIESAVKAKDQLERLLIDQGYSARSRRTDWDYHGQSQAIRQALCAGGFMQSAVECKRATYLTTKDNVEVKLHPASGLRTRPIWVIYNELVITTKAFIRTVTEVEGEWLLSASREYFNPTHFDNAIVSAEISKLTGVRRKSRNAVDDSVRKAY
mmetsp:Transcript_12038/g.36701  ORF Transcript_12038/g.36701 Transcript_12038/m.36701 type:complete len:816 (+) Transcript_12038:176-2623(+)